MKNSKEDVIMTAEEQLFSSMPADVITQTIRGVRFFFSPSTSKRFDPLGQEISFEKYCERVGPKPFRHMTKVIGGKRYSTETARKLFEWTPDLKGPYADSGERYLYVKRTGEYFSYTIASRRITPLTLDEAKFRVERYGTAEEYEEIFGGIEEAPEADARQITLILPIDILDTLNGRKEKSGVSVSAQITKILRAAGL